VSARSSVQLVTPPTARSALDLRGTEGDTVGVNESLLPPRLRPPGRSRRPLAIGCKASPIGSIISAQADAWSIGDGAYRRVNFDGESRRLPPPVAAAAFPCVRGYEPRLGAQIPFRA
jgi:hypothetical protein